jgi:glycosyltransferase involved in cell wall biosynthesis
MAPGCIKQEFRPLMISICIPSFNRPFELRRLLDSIDAPFNLDIEIIICEDCSPARDEIRNQVIQFRQTTSYPVLYIENPLNYGYDRNLRELITLASGDYIVFMGDDDEFLPGAIKKLISFLRRHAETHLAYVLKTHLLIHPDKRIELFKYFKDDTIFKPGPRTYMTLFRRSVFISGFIFRRNYALPYLTDRFDGTLLYQLYLLAELTMQYPSAYFSKPIILQYKGGTPFFGSSQTESKLYTPGTVTIDNSINFMSGFFKITRFIDAKYGIASTPHIRREISKYSYPVLSIQRKRGCRDFLKYHRRLRILHINRTFFYYAYLFGLLVLGEKICDFVILTIKRILGRTPVL